MSPVYSLHRFLLICFVLIGGTAFGQNGQFDVRFNFTSFDCNTFEAFVDVEVKATAPGTEFNLANQNYRFGFERAIVDPISPPIVGNPTDRTVGINTEFLQFYFSPDFSLAAFYDQNLTGSLDTLVSLNIVRTGGNSGVPMDPTVWFPVTRLRLDLKTDQSCLELKWNTDDPLDFPPTTITEIPNGSTTPIDVTPGNYLNFSQCFDALCNPLSVDLAYFTGVDAGCKVKLEWETITEVNNDYFIIEKSENGFDFEEIGRVPGYGLTSSPTTYAFMDEKSTDLNYYRLTQVDYNGEREVFETISVETRCFDELDGQNISAIFPNPVDQGQVNIKMLSQLNDENVNVLIYDGLGKLVDNRAVQLTEGDNLLTIDLKTMVNGIYTVQLQGTGWFSQPQKFFYIQR